MSCPPQHSIPPSSDLQSPAPQRKVLLLLGYYHVLIHLGIARYAREAGWAICDEYVRVGSAPLWWNGDGILSIITSPKDLQALQCYKPLPLVDLSKGWISDSMPPKARASGVGKPRVYYDNELISRMAAEHFLNRGFKHIAYLNTGNYWLDQERIPHMRHAVEQAGAVFHEIAFYRHNDERNRNSPPTHQDSHQWLVDTIAELPKPIGIMLTSDDHAPRLMQACHDAGVAIPEEVAILGCDNDPMVCDYTPIPLSSVDNDWDRIGYEAAQLLDRIMDGEAGPTEPILIPPKGVITRMSTDILAVQDPKIARALRFIWENFAQPIGTAEVANAAGINRRRLERGFSTYLHRTVYHEILRVRVKHAKKLLAETKKSTDDIADLSGFSSASAFSTAFTRVTGTRPGKFRKHEESRDTDSDGNRDF